MSKTRASRFIRGSRHLETIKALGLQPRAFICFSVSGSPDKTLALVFDILRRFQVYTTQNTTEMIRAFLQVNGRFQVYTTQDTTGTIRAFLQVNGRFQVYTTQDTTGMSRAFLQVNCSFQVYTTQVNTMQRR